MGVECDRGFNGIFLIKMTDRQPESLVLLSGSLKVTALNNFLAYDQQSQRRFTGGKHYLLFTPTLFMMEHGEILAPRHECCTKTNLFSTPPVIDLQQ